MNIINDVLNYKFKNNKYNSDLAKQTLYLLNKTNVPKIFIVGDYISIYVAVISYLKKSDYKFKELIETYKQAKKDYLSVEENDIANKAGLEAEMLWLLNKIIEYANLQIAQFNLDDVIYKEQTMGLFDSYQKNSKILIVKNFDYILTGNVRPNRLKELLILLKEREEYNLLCIIQSNRQIGEKELFQIFRIYAKDSTVKKFIKEIKNLVGMDVENTLAG